MLSSIYYIYFVLTFDHLHIYCTFLYNNQIHKNDKKSLIKTFFQIYSKYIFHMIMVQIKKVAINNLEIIGILLLLFVCVWREH